MRIAFMRKSIEKSRKSVLQIYNLADKNKNRILRFIFFNEEEIIKNFPFGKFL